MLWKLRVKKQVNTPRGSLRQMFYRTFIFFLPSNATRSAIKVFPEVNLVSLTPSVQIVF